MSKNHLKRLNAPRTWPIPRKSSKWITKQNPGPHKREESMPLSVIIKDLLKYAKTTKEVKKIIKNKDVLINRKIREDVRFPVGILDILEIPKTKESFLFLINKKGKFFLQKLDDKKTNNKYLKITGKKIIKNNKLQLNFHNGNNLITENKDYKVGDTLIINLENKGIIKHLKLNKGARVYLTKGRHVGCTGIIENIISSNKTKNNILEVSLETSGKTKIPKEYSFVIDDGIIK